MLKYYCFVVLLSWIAFNKRIYNDKTVLVVKDAKVMII